MKSAESGAVLGRAIRLAAVAAWLVARAATAQLPEAEEAFGRGDYRAARAGYEAVLARDSSNVRALYRLAVMDGWDGRYEQSLERFARLRRLEPLDPDIMVAHARVLWYAGRGREARVLLDSALAREPGRADALSLRAAQQPEVASAASYAHDTDENDLFTHEATVSRSLRSDLRATAHAGWRRASDRFRHALSFGLGGYAVRSLRGGAVLRAGLGIRRLEPEAATATTPLTAQLGVGLRSARGASFSAAYSRTPFDETALLIERGHTVDGLEVNLDLVPRPGLAASGVGSAWWLSDGNRRLLGMLTVTAGVLPGVEVGALGRLTGYRDAVPGRGYFAPDRFGVIELRGAYSWRRSRWSARADGGFGAQQVGVGAPTQAEWHAGFWLSRGWGLNGEVGLVGSVTNSAGARTGEAVAARYRHWMLGFRLSRGL